LKNVSIPRKKEETCEEKWYNYEGLPQLLQQAEFRMRNSRGIPVFVCGTCARAQVLISL